MKKRWIFLENRTKQKKRIILLLTIVVIIFQLFINMDINAIKDWPILVTYPMVIMLDELTIIGFTFNQNFALLIIHISIIIILKIKQIESETAFLISRILIIISAAVILFHLIIVNLNYLISSYIRGGYEALALIFLVTPIFLYIIEFVLYFVVYRFIKNQLQ